jgi:pyruvate,water dikinase
MQPLIVALDAAEAVDADRFGPKAANLARLGRGGLPIPAGFCVDAQAYRVQVEALRLAEAMCGVTSEDPATARRSALAVKLALLDMPIVPEVLDPLLCARASLVRATEAPMVVRSSALVEDRFGTSFAGQFESYLGLDTEEEFVTAVRSCWAALWSTRVLRYMAGHDASPAETAMAVLVQPLVDAEVAGGGLSRTGNGEMVLNAAWGLGAAVAQGEVVPDRIVLDRSDHGVELRNSVPGRRMHHRLGCMHGPRYAAPRASATKRCLTDAQALELAGLVLRAEGIMGMPVEVEWARDAAGFTLLQARPLHSEPVAVPDEIWLRHPALNGQAAGVGWGSGRACVVNCECELSRVGPGDILVTKVAGPALGHVLPRVAGVVAELGGSTSHLASLARERGIPMVLGVLDATERIPDGVQVAVDGVAGVVRWLR